MRKFIRLIAYSVLIFGGLFGVSNYALAKGGHHGGGHHHGGHHGHHDGHHHHGGHHHYGDHHHHGWWGGGWGGWGGGWGWGGWWLGVPVGYYGATYVVHDQKEVNTTNVVTQQPMQESSLLITMNAQFATVNGDWAKDMVANISDTKGVSYVDVIQGVDFSKNPNMALYLKWPLYDHMGITYKVYISHDETTKIEVGSTMGDYMYIPAKLLIPDQPNVIWIEVYANGKLVNGSPQIEL